MIIELEKLAQSFKTRLADSWKDLGLVIKHFKEVPIDEINHYQILVLKNMVDDKYADEAKLALLNAQIEADVLKYGELHKQVVSAHVLEELSRWNAEDN